MKNTPQPAGENAREWLNTDSPGEFTPTFRAREFFGKRPIWNGLNGIFFSLK